MPCCFCWSSTSSPAPSSHQGGIILMRRLPSCILRLMMSHLDSASLVSLARCCRGTFSIVDAGQPEWLLRVNVHALARIIDAEAEAARSKQDHHRFQEARLQATEAGSSATSAIAPAEIALSVYSAASASRSSVSHHLPRPYADATVFSAAAATASPAFALHEKCLLRLAIAIDLDASAERNTVLRQFLRRQVEPECLQGCPLRESEEKSPPRNTAASRIPNHGVPVPPLPMYDTIEMVRVLDALKVPSHGHGQNIAADPPPSQLQQPPPLVEVKDAVDASAPIAASSSDALARRLVGPASIVSHRSTSFLSDSCRVQRLRYRGPTGASSELVVWKPVLEHAALQHLCALELHPSLPRPDSSCRATGYEPSTYLPLNVLSLLTPRILSQLTHLKLVHPAPTDALSQLLLMTRLTRLGVRGASAAAIDTIRQCGAELRHLRLLDGLRAYRYGQRTGMLFVREDSAVTRLHSLYLGWNCMQPLESPWASIGRTDGFMDLDYHRLFTAFSTRLTQLTQLELEGYLYSTMLAWQWTDEFAGYNDEFGVARADEMARNVDWSSGRHAGVLTGCHSLRRLILYGVYEQCCSLEAFNGPLFALPQLHITLHLLHPSCNRQIASIAARALAPSPGSSRALRRLSPRLTCVPHPEADQRDYVPLHGDAF